MQAIVLAAFCALALSQGAPTCGPNTHYNDCASACPKTCDDPNPTICVAMCVSTCECDDGYLLNSDSACVPAEVCLPATTDAAPATSDSAVPSSGAPMPGGHSPVDATSELVMQAATCAIAQWNAENGNSLAQQLSHIVAGTQQVVAGVLYNLVLATHPVGCANDCHTQLMAAQIWLRPWLTESCVVQNITLIDAVDLPLSTAAPVVEATEPAATEPASSASALASGLGGAPGSPRPLDPSSSSAVQAALCAVSALNAQSNSIYQLQLVRIVSGTSQVVSGARYAMRIATGFSTTCRNDGSTPDLQRCPVGSNVISEWDVSVLVQPWKSPSCSVLSTAAVVSQTTAAVAPSQTSTEAPASGPLVGGQQPLDVSSSGAQQAALCAVSTLNAQSNSLYQLQLVNIISGTSQLVAGTRYRMRIATGLSMTCRNDGSTPDLQRCPVGSNTASEWDVDVVVQPWQTPACNVISTTAVTAPESTTTAPASTVQPPAPLGSGQSLDINDAAVQDAALCAVSALNAQSNSIYQLQLVRIVSGTSQLVAGTRYAMRIATGLSTTCRNDGSTPDLQHCPVGSNAVSEYDVVVLVQPWQNPSCNVLSTTAVAPPSTPTPLTGGSEPVDVTSTEVTDAAVCAVAALNARSNSVYQLELVDVITGTQQVVAGMRYHLSMTVASAQTCLNSGATPSLAACPVDLSTAAQYNADVVVTPWASPSCTVLAVSVASTGDQSMGVSTGSSSSSSSSTSPALWAAVGIATALIVVTGVVYAVRARMQHVSPPANDALGERLLQEDS